MLKLLPIWHTSASNYDRKMLLKKRSDLRVRGELISKSEIMKIPNKMPPISNTFESNSCAKLTKDYHLVDFKCTNNNNETDYEQIISYSSFQISKKKANKQCHSQSNIPRNSLTRLNPKFNQTKANYKENCKLASNNEDFNATSTYFDTVEEYFEVANNAKILVSASNVDINFQNNSATNSHVMSEVWQTLPKANSNNLSRDSNFMR